MARGQIIWPKLQQYRHIVAYNPSGLTVNCNLYDVFLESSRESQVLCAILNSTIVALLKYIFGSQMGREGNQVTEIFDVKMMLVPDIRLANKEVINRLRSALVTMRKRKALPLVEVDGVGLLPSGELALKDRQELDDAVLELLGITKAKERETLRAELYAAMTTLYREIRVTGKKMQKFRSMTARHGRPSPQSIADEIWESFVDKPIAKALSEFVPANAKTEQVLLPAGKARLVKNDMFNPNSLQFGGHFVALGSPERAEYAMQLSEDGIGGQIAIPVDAMICKAALHNYRAHVEKLNEIFASNASAYTADEQMQERVVRELWRKAQKRE